MGNIVWVASYPKSGNTWVRTFLENYIQNLPQAVDINTLHKVSTAEAYAHRYQAHLSDGKVTTDLSAEELCNMRMQVHADIAAQAQGTTFVKTHNLLGQYRGHQLHNSRVTAGAIYVVRNPLDVVISMANYFDYSLDEAIDYMAEVEVGTPNETANVPQIISSWSNHVKSWTEHQQPAFLVLRYEDLLADAKKAFRKIESFLGMKKDPARLRKAIMHSSFDALKRQESSKGFVEKHENANAFFRQGRKNQWQHVLSTEQVDRIVAAHSEQMKRFKYLP